jgi:Zn-dependent peptidase ImmA (M78 family)
VPRIIRAEVNPEILVWARNSIGLSLQDAAKKAQVPVYRLKEWESGDSKPTLRQARLLAKAYRRPSAFFYLEAPPDEPPQLPDFRTIPTAAEEMPPELIYEIRRARFRRDIAIRLRQVLSEPIPDFTLSASLDEDPEVVGSRIREHLGVSLEEQQSWETKYVALNSWIRSIEAAGVLIFQFSGIDVSLVRGFSIPDLPLPAISINGGDSPRARVFTLLHEICHLALGTGGVCDLHESNTFADAEVFSNAAAAQALVPADSILQQSMVSSSSVSKEWDDFELQDLADEYHVSREVILRRLLSLGKASPAFYRLKRQEWQEEYAKLSKKKDGGFFRYHKKVVRNNGLAFTSLVLDAYNQQAISAIDVSRYLGDIRLNHLPAIEGDVVNA